MLAEVVWCPLDLPSLLITDHRWLGIWSLTKTQNPAVLDSCVHLSRQLLWSVTDRCSWIPSAASQYVLGSVLLLIQQMGLVSISYVYQKVQPCCTAKDSWLLPTHLVPMVCPPQSRIPVMAPWSHPMSPSLTLCWSLTDLSRSPGLLSTSLCPMLGGTLSGLLESPWWAALTWLLGTSLGLCAASFAISISSIARDLIFSSSRVVESTR